MSKPVVIFYGNGATENKCLVLDNALCWVVALWLTKCFYIHFLCGSHSERPCLGQKLLNETRSIQGVWQMLGRVGALK